MNDLVFAQLYYKEIQNRLLNDESNKQVNENRKRANFVDMNKRFHK